MYVLCATFVSTTSITTVVMFPRYVARLFFAWMRAMDRACNYISSLLGILSGALSFTVIASIILSVISAFVAIAGLGFKTAADLMEPIVMTAISWLTTGATSVRQLCSMTVTCV